MIRALGVLAISLMSAVPPAILPARWTPLRPHLEQSRFAHSAARFNVVPAGRRSGKTEIAKRKLIRRALAPPRFFPARYFAAAPTFMQAKRIFWADLKALMPPHLVAGKPSEGELVIRIKNGTEIHVLGMDKPARIEGSPWDGGVLDEYANMKESVWDEHVRPALADRRGWCDLTGVPEGRNHYYRRWMKSKTDISGEWAGFTWKSADILDPREIAAAREDLDPLVFQQEYEASFVNFVGRAYYAFDIEKHACPVLNYDPTADLILCFDFNISPGVAAIAQEQRLPRRIGEDWKVEPNAIEGTGFIGEVWIPQGSNTEIVCRKIVADWGKHRGIVRAYGDATGGSGGSAQLAGSDVEIVERELGRHFGERLRMHFPRSNPSERARINAVNSRLLTSTGLVRMLIDPDKAKHLVEDLDGVRLVEGGSGEIDKNNDKRLSHISDAIGYYTFEEFPITEPIHRSEELIL